MTDHVSPRRDPRFWLGFVGAAAVFAVVRALVWDRWGFGGNALILAAGFGFVLVGVPLIRSVELRREARGPD